MKVFSNNFHHWLSFERKAVGKVEEREVGGGGRWLSTKIFKSS